MIGSGERGLANTTTGRWLFIPSSHSSQGSSPTARHPRTHQIAPPPSSIYFALTKASADEFIAEAMRLLAASLVEAETQGEQDLMNAAPYVNYSLFGRPLEVMYGEHLERLREIKEQV